MQPSESQGSKWTIGLNLLRGIVFSIHVNLSESNALYLFDSFFFFFSFWVFPLRRLGPKGAPTRWEKAHAREEETAQHMRRGRLHTSREQHTSMREDIQGSIP